MARPRSVGTTNLKAPLLPPHARRSTQDAAGHADGATVGNRYAPCFEHAPIGMIELDVTLDPPTIVAANAAAGRLYGLAPAELDGRPLDELFADGAALRLARIVAAVRQGRTVGIEVRQARHDGEVFAARLHMVSVPGSEGRLAWLMVDDISADLRRRDDLAAIDHDRRRLAHEIHDGLAQNLAALRLRASRWLGLLDSDPERLRAELATMGDDLKKDIREARRAIFALRPVQLDEAGFEASLRQLSRDMGEQYGFAVTLEVLGSVDRVPATLELPLLRILQESLNNVGRHANAATVAVRLDVSTADRLTLEVQDDGTGFEVAARDHAHGPAHYGLQQMRERAEGYNGVLEILSQPGAGTTVGVTWPIDGAA